MSTPLPVIVGPTAAGKSSLALQLAEQFHLAIVSADSRQIYRGFDIGTAKPTPADQHRVPHYGINCCDPMQRYSAHQFAADATQWCEASRRDGRAPLVVGGTGFYIRALVHPLHEAPPIPEGPRRALDAYLETLSGSVLEQWCRRLDPARAHLGRTQHLRAIETALLTGSRLSDVFASPGDGHEPAMWAARYLVVDPGPVLAARIAERVRRMVHDGWVDEVRALQQTVPFEAPAWNACGYSRIYDVVRGVSSLSDAIERITIETRQYAKRQRTWNRHQLPANAVTHVDITADNAFETACRWYETVARSGA